MVRKRARKKTFIPHDDVRLDEYIYYGNRLRTVESPLVQIINSIIGFLDSGMYVDTTGVALHNTSPQQPTNENKQNRNTTTTMKKKQTIKLNEGCAVQLPEKYRGIEYEIRKELSQWYNHIGYKYTKRTSFPKDTINYIIYAVLSDAVKGYQDVSLAKVETDAKINENKNSNKMKQTIKLNESQ